MEIVSATLLPMVIFSSFLVLVCLLLFTDCGLEKEENSVFLDSLFDVFEDCGLRSRESQEQQQLIRSVITNQSSKKKLKIIPNSVPQRQQQQCGDGREDQHQPLHQPERPEVLLCPQTDGDPQSSGQET